MPTAGTKRRGKLESKVLRLANKVWRLLQRDLGQISPVPFDGFLELDSYRHFKRTFVRGG